MGKKKETEPYYKQMAKLSQVMQLALLVRRAGQRLDVHLKRIKDWRPDDGMAEARDALEKVVEGLDLVAKAFEDVPDSYTPREPRVRRVQLEPGTTVRFTDKRVPEYETVLKKREMKDLRVVSISGSRMFVRSKAGTIINIPKSHVMAQES